MIALDTNLLARLLLQDDKAQHARVRALLATDRVFTAPVTVLLVRPSLDGRSEGSRRSVMNQAYG